MARYRSKLTINKDKIEPMLHKAFPVLEIRQRPLDTAGDTEFSVICQMKRGVVIRNPTDRSALVRDIRKSRVGAFRCLVFCNTIRQKVFPPTITTDKIAYRVAVNTVNSFAS